MDRKESVAEGEERVHDKRHGNIFCILFLPLLTVLGWKITIINEVPSILRGVFINHELKEWDVPWALSGTRMIALTNVCLTRLSSRHWANEYYLDDNLGHGCIVTLLCPWHWAYPLFIQTWTRLRKYFSENKTLFTVLWIFLVYNFQAFIKQRNYPAHVPVTKVPESGEPSEFKALFKQWDIMRTPAQMKAYSNNKIG